MKDTGEGMVVFSTSLFTTFRLVAESLGAGHPALEPRTRYIIEVGSHSKL